FLETLNAFQRTSALKAAVELRVFSAIGQTPSTAAEVAERCQCPERGIRILCDNLTIFGFLTKEGPRYALTPSSSVFLDERSPAYLGGIVRFMLSPSITAAFDDLAATIRSGRVFGSEHG